MPSRAPSSPRRLGALGARSGRWPADPPTMTARVLLQGHARLGSWIAIQVHLHNDGPSVSGELRLQGGSPGRHPLRGARPARQPVGQGLDPLRPAAVVRAAARGRPRQRHDVIARQKVAVTVHDPTQLVVGVVAEDPPAARRDAEPAGRPEPAAGRRRPARRSRTCRPGSRPGRRWTGSSGRTSTRRASAPSS